MPARIADHIQQLEQVLSRSRASTTPYPHPPCWKEVEASVEDLATKHMLVLSRVVVVIVTAAAVVVVIVREETSICLVTSSSLLGLAF